MDKYILVFNGGSATLKFGLFVYHRPDREIKSGNFERIGLNNSFLKIGRQKWQFKEKISYRRAAEIIVQKLGLDKKSVALLGHRVVHGGQRFTRPTVVTAKVWRQIAVFNELAPLHNPGELQVISACYRLFPGVKNVAVFDTAFFAKLKPEYYLYALPYEFYEKHQIRRYGFHGISHQAAATAAAKKLGRPLNKINLITVHLGNGCSIVAIQKGVAVKTSLGFTPLEGLVMGTRCGDLDPAIPLYLQKKFRLSAVAVEEILNKKSGLLGLSGFSSDMREILKAAGQPVVDYHGRAFFSDQQRRRARLALKVFITRLRNYIILYTAMLGGEQAIVFTGGIGERSPVVRRLAVQGINFKKKPKIITVPADEETAIARQIKNKV